MSTHDKGESGRAFEYVSGTLSGSERAEYEALLASVDRASADMASVKEERALVKFWQEQLLSLDKHAGEIPPDPDTWQKIAMAIGVVESPQPTTKAPGSFFTIWFAWASTAVAMLVLSVILIKPLLNPPVTIPNTDYIAVLTDTEGTAVLTALTTAKENLMWLQWETAQQGKLLENADQDSGSLQLWAISKRDGQVRSLAIFDDMSAEKLALDEATFRLVTDASFLLLTREEAGGSAIDEPSEELIARGVCVRFKGEKA